VRLRSFLVVTIVSLLLTTVLVVAGISFANGKRSAEALSEAVLGQAVERVDQRVRSELDVAQTERAVAAHLLSVGVVPADDLDAVLSLELELLASHPSLATISFTRATTGELAQVDRGDDCELHARRLRRKADGLALSVYAVGQQGLHLLRELPPAGDNDPRTRPFYLAATVAKHAVWTETYAFRSESAQLGIPGASYATPVVAAAGGEGSLLGVLTADFDLRGTSRFLRDLEMFPHGAAFVVEYRKGGARAVVAHPSPELLVPGGSQEAVHLEQIADPRIVAFAGALPRELPQRREKVAPVHFSVGGEDYFGSYRLLGGGEPHWIVAAMVPEEDIIGEVERNNRITLVIVVIGTVLAIVIALWLGARVERPLRAIVDETEAIGRFRLEVQPTEKTSIIEVARLSSAVEEMKRNLRSFRKYVPADVVRELVAKGEEASLGGRRETLTIHFSDIAGFTSIAETMPPEQLVTMLGEYLDEMTRPILASGGTVDKFIGDAVMAFWGAPAADADHALHACEAALANRDRLAVLNARWQSEGRPRLDARAALHTGEVIVGNIGSLARLEYTVIGDSVNLASRLEGLNKKYGTYLMISDTTYARVKDVMVVRPLDRVAVKGKAQSVDVYELLGRKGEVDAAAVARAERHRDAFARYLARDFDAAARMFAELVAERVAQGTDDVAAKVLEERCRELAAAPPPDEWTGAVHMTTK
jgi:adenylate cyclase